jgi:hypothetical protein
MHRYASRCHQGKVGGRAFGGAGTYEFGGILLWGGLAEERTRSAGGVLVIGRAH